MFRDSEAKTGADLLRLTEGSNSHELQQAAHAAKGAAQSAYAIRLAELCSALEQSAKSRDWPEIRVLGPRVDAEFRRVLQFIDEYVANGP